MNELEKRFSNFVNGLQLDHIFLDILIHSPDYRYRGGIRGTITGVCTG